MVKYFWKSGLLSCLLALSLLGLPLSVRANDDVSAPLSPLLGVNRHLQQKLAAAPLPLSLAGEPLAAAQLLHDFYASREYRPLWVSEDAVNVQATTLLERIKKAGDDGLRGADYHTPALELLIAKQAAINSDMPAINDPGGLADIELLLSDAYLLYGLHLQQGRVLEYTNKVRINFGADSAVFIKSLDQAAADGLIEKNLDGLAPQRIDYVRLRDALVAMRKQKEDSHWAVPEDGVLHPGAMDSRVPKLRVRLLLTGDLTEAPADKASQEYDAVLQEAMRRFQRRHGLVADGVAGHETWVALNISLRQRMGQLAVNLQRLRWLNANALGERYLQINIPGYELDLFDQGQKILNSRVIVGRDYRRTPLFRSELTQIVLNPYWRVPHKLAVQDVWKEIQKNPAYLEEMQIQVLSSWEPDAEVVDPATVNWHELTAEDFPYHFRQLPGPKNALGRIKFMMPNNMSIYMHDTPTHQLFEERRRGFSSGCIRIEKHVELALYLLKDDPKWSRESLDKVWASGATRYVPIKNPLPVYLTYITAWVDDEGRLQFRDDIYGMDKTLAAALRVPLFGRR